MAKHTEDGIEMNKMDIIIGWTFVLCVALVIAFGMFGCNTVKGLAKDVYAVTEGIQNEMATDSDRDGERPSNWD